MARVRSISNHPYSGTMRAKGCEYEAAAADVNILVALGRVIVIPEESPSSGRQTYGTRELHASAPGVSIARSRRRAAPASDSPIADDPTHSVDES
jgi:hypothetical protein